MSQPNAPNPAIDTRPLRERALKRMETPGAPWITGSEVLGLVNELDWLRALLLGSNGSTEHLPGMLEVGRALNDADAQIAALRSKIHHALEALSI